MDQIATGKLVTLLNTIIAMLEDDDISYHTEEGGIVWLTLRGDTSSWSCHMSVEEDEDWGSVVIVSRAPVAVPEARRGAVMEWITRKNYDLKFGGFQMDLTDGEVLYKTELILADGILTRAMFSSIFEINFHMMNSSIQELMMVAFGGVDPAMAIRDAHPPEGADEPQLQ
ncbi:MAG: YbjN domain-containing protein [Acidiferrobacter sp.]